MIALYVSVGVRRVTKEPVYSRKLFGRHKGPDIGVGYWRHKDKDIDVTSFSPCCATNLPMEVEKIVKQRRSVKDGDYLEEATSKKRLF